MIHKVSELRQQKRKIEEAISIFSHSLTKSTCNQKPVGHFGLHQRLAANTRKPSWSERPNSPLIDLGCRNTTKRELIDLNTNDIIKHRPYLEKQSGKKKYELPQVCPLTNFRPENSFGQIASKMNAGPMLVESYTESSPSRNCRLLENECIFLDPYCNPSPSHLTRALTEDYVDISPNCRVSNISQEISQHINNKPSSGINNNFVLKSKQTNTDSPTLKQTEESKINESLCYTEEMENYLHNYYTVLNPEIDDPLPVELSQQISYPSSNDSSNNLNFTKNTTGKTSTLGDIEEDANENTIDLFVDIGKNQMKHSIHNEFNDHECPTESTSEEDEDDSADPNPLNNCFCNPDKSSMPFKKRKRMRQMTYPQSRFIDCRKVPIFHLTVEEEFKIYNIDFRRDLVWKEYLQLMKESFDFESLKSKIFLSAFGLKRVVLDPSDWLIWTNAAQENHAKCAEIFEEVAALPKDIWDKIKTENSKTWSTFSWSLCWANADSENLIEQESKAGFWGPELQVHTIR